MRKPYVGTPAALNLATPKPRRKKSRRPAVDVSFPVFYDKSGKRLRRIVVTVCALLLTLGTVAAIVVPAALAPAMADHNNDGFARRYLADTEGDTTAIPAIGPGGVLTRMVTVEREHIGTAAPPGPDPALLEPIPVPDDDGDGMPDEPQLPELADPPPMSPLALMDPVTGKFIRYATEVERVKIGDSPYAIEHSGAVPDHTLMLTFDDGPSAEWTGQILDVLSREHVPATFFVMGERVLKNPDLLQREVREGHMVGNHTWSHLDFDTQTDFRNQQEVNGTDRVIRAEARYATPLFRIPEGDPDNNPVAQLASQQLGSLQVDFDLDTNDWRYEPGQEVPVPPLDGRGHVVLLHDAGGESRAGTVAMLKKLIHDARAQGYTFTTLAPILPPNYLPQKDVQPTVADRATLLAAQATVVTPRKVLTAVFWFGVGSMLIFTACYLVLSVINERRQRRRAWPDTPDNELPFVSIVLAAYNEEKVITRTLDTLRESDYPVSRFEVVAVNDGSSDATLEILRAYDWDKLRVVDQPNSGKSSAINNGVNHADAESTVIMTMDADTLFRADTVRRLARHFVGNRHGKKQVGAVAGHVKVGNRNNILTAWQSLEYLNGICVIRMAEMMVGAVGIVPGACSAWNRDALERIGGFSEDTLAEDADAAMTFQRLGYAVLHDNHAICDTEAPESIVPLLKQRKRWMFGNFQVLWKNRGMLFRPRYGALGMVTMPFSIAQLFLNLVFMPVLFITAGLALAQGDWRPVAMGAAIILAVHTFCAIAAIAIAREKLWHLLVLPVYRPIYEAMRVYLLYATFYRVLKGTEFAWDKLERRNSVVAHKGKDQNDEPETGSHAVVLGGYGDDRLRMDDELARLGSARLIGEPSRV